MTSCIIEATERIVAAARAPDSSVGGPVTSWNTSSTRPACSLFEIALDQARIDAKHVRCETAVPVQAGQLGGGISVAEHLLKAVRR